MKSFLRIEYHRNTNEPVAICIHVPHLKYCLRQKKVDYEQGVLTNLTSVYANMCKGGVLRTFLSLDSSLSEIPKGIKGRKTKGAVYQRCVEIQSSCSHQRRSFGNYR